MFALCLFFALFTVGLWAEPSALVNNPADIRFVELGNLARFLEQDLDLGKGISEVVGKKVIDSRFRKAGMPDPAKEPVSYSMVVREMPVDQLNVAFILKGAIDIRKFLEFSDKRYYRYFANLQKHKIDARPRIPANIKISNKPTRVYPFAFRDAEALVSHFADFTIIATVPRGDYRLISDVIKVLDGEKAMSQRQSPRISFMASFIPRAQERQEIRTFEGQHEGFVAKARSGFKKVTNKKAWVGEEKMIRLEDSLKTALSEVERFSYSVDASARGDGYAYDINMIFKCADQQKAAQLKEMLLAWLASNSAKALSEEDLVSFKSNKVASDRENCVFSVKLGSSAAEQYQFSSMIMTLMMQDRRFNRIFKS